MEQQTSPWEKVESMLSEDIQTFNDAGVYNRVKEYLESEKKCVRRIAIPKFIFEV